MSTAGHLLSAMTISRQTGRSLPESLADVLTPVALRVRPGPDKFCSRIVAFAGENYPLLAKTQSPNTTALKISIVQAACEQDTL
jgi:hypothetical protein